MRAEERPDGVALPASRFGDLGGGRTVFPPQKFLPCCPRGAWISSRIPRLLPSSSCPAGSGSVGVFRGSRIVFRFVTSGPIPEKFSMYSNTAIFRECKTWLDAREDERS